MNIEVDLLDKINAYLQKKNLSTIDKQCECLYNPDFKTYTIEKKITKNCKKRKIIIFDPIKLQINDRKALLNYGYSLYLFYELKRKCHIVFPNRDKILFKLFNHLEVLKYIEDFTIFKFDFEDFFDSISTKYILKKYLYNCRLSEQDLCVLEKYTDDVPLCTAGLPLSNLFSEIIGSDFDKHVIEEFGSNSFYVRYVDDCFLICRGMLERSEIEKRIYFIMDSVFRDNNITNCICTTKLNKNKTTYINLNELNKIEYLGYEISFTKGSDNLNIILGIADSKQKKITNRIQDKLNRFLSENYSPLSKKTDYYKAISFFMKFRARRIVFFNSKKKIWEERGIIANYKYLNFFGNDNVDKKTKTFLTYLYVRYFHLRGNDTKCPYFLQQKCNKVNNKVNVAYDLYFNLINKKTYIFNEYIGISMSDLKNIASFLRIQVSEENYFNYMLEIFKKCRMRL